MPNEENGELLSLEISVSDEEAIKKLKEFNKQLKSSGQYSDQYKKAINSLFGYAGGKLNSSALSEVERNFYSSIISSVNKIKSQLKKSSGSLSSLWREKPDAEVFGGSYDLEDLQYAAQEIAERRKAMLELLKDDGYGDDWVKRVVKESGAMVKQYEEIKDGIKLIRKESLNAAGELQDLQVTEKRKTPEQIAKEEERAQKEAARAAEKQARAQEKAKREAAREAEKQARAEEKERKAQERNRKETQKQLQKPFTSGLLKKVGGIITYRITRTIITAFTNAFKQGFSLLKDDNNIVGDLSTTFQSIGTTFSVSMTTLVIPILQSLSTVIEPIAGEFLNLANSISYALSDNETYFRLSKEKIDEYAKSLKNANSQLSQLDKFATLTGTKKVDLGDYISKTDTSDERVFEDVANIDKYSNIINFIDNVADYVKKLTDAFSKLGIGGVAAIGGITLGLATLVGAVNPVVTALIGLTGVFLSSSTEMNVLSTALVALSGALIGVGIAKHFAINPINGALGGIAAGLAVAGVVNTLSGGINTGSSSLNPRSSYNVGGLSGEIGNDGSDVAMRVATQSEKSASGGSGQVQGDVYLDGEKVGKIITPNVYKNGVRSGYFTAK